MKEFVDKLVQFSNSSDSFAASTFNDVFKSTVEGYLFKVLKFDFMEILKYKENSTVNRPEFVGDSVV